MSTRALLAGLVGIAAFTTISFAQTSVSPPDGDEPTIVATGDVTLSHAPDVAFVTIAVDADDGKPRNAERKAAETMSKVRAALAPLALGDAAIRTTSFTLQPRLQFGGGRRYFLRHVIEVRVDDLDKLGDVLDAAGEARAEAIGSLRFDLKDRQRVELEALRLAVKDATERAHAIAAGSGRSLAPVLRIQEHRLSAPAPVVRIGGDLPAVAARGGGNGPTPTAIEPGEVQIRAQVTLTAGVQGFRPSPF